MRIRSFCFLLFVSLLVSGGVSADDFCLRDSFGNLVFSGKQNALRTSKIDVRAFRAKMAAFLKKEGYEDFLHGERNEYLLHGTTKSAATELEAGGMQEGLPFFTTANPETARIFSERTLQKIGQKDVQTGYVVLIISEQRLTALIKAKQVLRRQVPDMPGHYETIIQPGAFEAVERDGTFVQLPDELFR